MISPRNGTVLLRRKRSAGTERMTFAVVILRELTASQIDGLRSPGPQTWLTHSAQRRANCPVTEVK